MAANKGSYSQAITKLPLCAGGGSSGASRTREFAQLKRQLDAADADIELVNKRLDEAQDKCYYLVNAT